MILTLIQLGGLGLVTLTSFFYLLIGKRVGLRTAHLTQESVGSDQRLNTGKLTKFLVFFTAVMELLGGLLLSIYFVPRFGLLLQRRLRPFGDERRLRKPHLR